MGLHAWSISYCDHTLSDGFVPSGAWPALAGAAVAVKALVAAGLWIPEERGFRLHDYGDYNRTRAQVVAEQQAKAAAGRAGGLARVANAQANGKHVLEQVPKHVPKQNGTNGKHVPKQTPKQPLKQNSTPGPGPGVTPAAAAASYPVSGVSGENPSRPSAREVSPELLADHERYLARERATKQAAAAAADPSI